MKIYKPRKPSLFADKSPLIRARVPETVFRKIWTWTAVDDDDPIILEHAGARYLIRVHEPHDLDFVRNRYPITIEPLSGDCDVTTTIEQGKVKMIKLSQQVQT